MAGLYVHIPFCKDACSYCDFHFSIQLGQKRPMVSAICKELQQRKDFFAGQTLESIYFGGGTPSLLDIDELKELIHTVHTFYGLSPLAEITLEANPDDLTAEYCRGLNQLGINRLSIGIQSWYAQDLVIMNRKHTVADGEKAIHTAQAAGIGNISIDLIYGLPGMRMERWKENLGITFNLGITHLSAYHLTYEPGTKLYHQEKKGRIRALPEEDGVQQYFELLEEAERRGFIQYELSNLCKPGYESKHNSAYWSGKSYLGIGPSAHTYDGKGRSWNISNNRKYMEGIRQGARVFESEELSIADRYNEYVMTSLRTVAGGSPDHIRTSFGEAYADYFGTRAENYIKLSKAFMRDGNFALNREGMVLSDRIIADLMWV